MPYEHSSACLKMWDRTLNSPSKFQNRDPPSPIVWPLKPGSLPGAAVLLICLNGPHLHPGPENKGSVKLPPYTTCLVLAEGFRTRLPSPWEVWRALGSSKMPCSWNDPTDWGNCSFLHKSELFPSATQAPAWNALLLLAKGLLCSKKPILQVCKTVSWMHL